MSGIAGGDRITRQATQPTVNKYISTVLSKFPGYISYSISGSFNSNMAKNDFGDIDLIITIKSKLSKPDVKKQLVDFFVSFPETVIVPFKSDKAKGKRTYNSGELVTILFPQVGEKNKFVQIDNIVALSEKEHDFKTEFLNLPANKQGLLIGLVRSAWIEYGNDIFKRLKIKTPPLKKGQEFEFVISSDGLSLRRVTLTKDFKELNRETLWKSSNWKDVFKLFPEEKYNFSLSFEDLVQQIQTLGFKNPRSAKRLSGLFQSMVSVKSGEVGKEKGIEKEKSINKIKNVFESYLTGKMI